MGILGIIPAAAEVQNNPEYPGTSCGGDWHWVHNQLSDGVDSGVLTVTFSDGSTHDIYSWFNGEVLHYTMTVDSGLTLVSAEDNVIGGKLLLSDWPTCQDTTTTSQQSTTTKPYETTTSTYGTTTTYHHGTTTTAQQWTTTTSEMTTTSTTEGSTTTSTTEGSTTTSTTEGSTTTTSRPTTTTAAIEDGQLILFKKTLPAGQPDVFTVVVNATYGDKSWTVEISDGETVTLEDMPPGMYSVIEQLPDPTDFTRWDLDSIVCDDGSSSDAVSIDSGETVSCTLTNVKTEVEATTVTTVPPVTGSTLPFTGAELTSRMQVALILLGGGALLLALLSSRRRTE